MGQMAHQGPSMSGLGPWVLRIGALVLGVLLIFGLIGPCMK